MKSASPKALNNLIEEGLIQLTRGKVISKKDLAACPGKFPVYSSAKDNDGKLGEYGRYMFDEEMITWSVDGGGRLFHRPKHKFSVTNVGGILRILDRSVLTYRYLYYVLSLRHSELSFDWVRKAHPSIIKKLYTNIPIPALNEQRRIVEVLDEANSALAAAKASTELNLRSRQAFFESCLHSVFNDLWLNCKLVTLADIATSITDGDHMPPPKSETGVPFITIGSLLKETHEINFSDTFMVPRSYYDSLKPFKRPVDGDVLFTVTGSYGIPIRVRGNLEFCFQRHIGLIRPQPQTDSDWLYYLMLSPQILNQAHRGATGTAQKTVSLSVLRSMVVPSVPLDKQRAIAKDLNALSYATQRLENTHSEKLKLLQELETSFLHHAIVSNKTS